MAFSFLTERLENIARRVFPLAFLALLLGVNLVGIPLPYVGLIKAPVFLIGIYYWAIYRPTLLPPWIIFLCGGVIDFIGDYPLGLNMLVLVAVRWLISEQRRFLMAQTFAMLWVSYAVVALSHAFLLWLLLSIIRFTPVPVVEPLVSTALSAMLFPPIYLVLLGTHKFLPPGAQGYGFKGRA